MLIHVTTLDHVSLTVMVRHIKTIESNIFNTSGDNKIDGAIIRLTEDMTLLVRESKNEICRKLWCRNSD